MRFQIYFLNKVELEGNVWLWEFIDEYENYGLLFKSERFQPNYLLPEIRRFN